MRVAIIITFLIVVFRFSYGEEKPGNISAATQGHSVYDGFIVMNNTDTVTGKLIMPLDSVVVLETIMKFIIGDSVYRYPPGTIKGFAYWIGADTFCFESLPNDLYLEVVVEENPFSVTSYPIRGLNFFFQKVVDGYYSLYYLNNVRIQGSMKSVITGYGNIPTYGNQRMPTWQSTSYLDEDLQEAEKQKGISAKTDSYYAVKTRNGSLIVIQPKKAPLCFADDKVLMHKIATKVYGYRNMPEVVREYNDYRNKQLITPVRY